MPYDPQEHHRRSVRLKGYDYSWTGYYFVTICTQRRQPLLGRIENEDMILSAAGAAVQSVWEGLPSRWPEVGLDAFVIMPNHLHGIITLRTWQLGVGSSKKDEGAINRAPTPPSLGEIVRTFKGASTHQIRQACLRDFSWQRN